MTDKAAPGGESSLTLQRGLALLQAVADTETEAVSISELATAIGASRAAVYRLLAPLSERGLIWRDGTKVRLGLGLLVLASRVFPQLRAVAIPILRELAETVGATAHLSVADGDEVQPVAVVEPSWTSFHVGYRVGSKHSIGRGAAGKALLLPVDGPQWAESTGELEPGASGVAAPVRDLHGLRASVGVVSLEPLHADTVGPHIVRTAELIAAALR
ncbi:MAG: helix-turn-helix domain-containing protein [Pseudonocardiaceae bacterium]|nr:helix-turn-helix domain-containing protein [Pseudonocardiaceae bacterium]